MVQYEEHQESENNRKAWLWIIVFAVGLLGWCMFTMIVIKDVPRKWDFEILPDAPGQSIYSTGEYKEELFPPAQIEKFPEVKESTQTPNQGNTIMQGDTLK